MREKYEKLAPIVIQGSYHLPRLEEEEAQIAIDSIVKQKLFNPENYILCTAFESGNEIAMKNYILKPHKRLEISKGKYWIVRGGLQ